MRTMKIQPIDVDTQATAAAVAAVARAEPSKPLVLKSRLKRLFDRQFSTVLRISSADKLSFHEQPQLATAKEAAGVEVEPSSLCLANMVQSYLEDTNDAKHYRGKHRCNCFNPNGNDSSDDEYDAGCLDPYGDPYDSLKNLVLCPTVSERNLLADTVMILEKNKNQNQRKCELRNAVAIGLSSIGYNSSIAKSKWEKSSPFPAGEYEYIDVVVEGGERFLVDIEFRSEFEIARSTKAYKSMLQFLPTVYVGKPERLDQIVTIVSEAARMSLKKKGMYCPPWRKVEYVRAKWLSPYSRHIVQRLEVIECCAEVKDEDVKGELDLIFGDESDNITTSVPSNSRKILEWQPPAIKNRGFVGAQRGTKVVTGLASLLKEKP